MPCQTLERCREQRLAPTNYSRNCLIRESNYSSLTNLRYSSRGLAKADASRSSRCWPRSRNPSASVRWVRYVPTSTIGAPKWLRSRRRSRPTDSPHSSAPCAAQRPAPRWCRAGTSGVRRPSGRRVLRQPDAPEPTGSGVGRRGWPCPGREVRSRKRGVCRSPPAVDQGGYRNGPACCL